MDRIIIYKSKKKALIITISSILVAVAAHMFLRYTDKDVIGWCLYISSWLMLILGMGTLFDRKPKIILTSRGITDISTIHEEIEWDAIRQVDEFFFRGQYFIRILVDRNYKPGLIFPTWFYRFDRIYAKEGAKALFIRVSLLDVNSIHLTQMMRKMIEADNRQEALKTMV